MKKYWVIVLISFITITISCNKNKSNEEGVFVPVKISYDVTVCACCGTGYFVGRQDSMITYKCDSIPPNTVITSLPATVKIRFHTSGPGCPFAKIVIDEIKE